MHIPIKQVYEYESRKYVANLSDSGYWIIHLYKPLYKLKVTTSHSSMEESVAILQARQGQGIDGTMA